MAFGAAQVHQAAFGQQVDAPVARHVITVHLRLDVHPGDAFGLVEEVHLDLVVEVADVADDRLVFHLEHVLQRDDVAIARAGDVNVRLAQRGFDGGHFKPFHCGLQSVDGVDLHTITRAPKPRRLWALPLPTSP